MPVANMAVEKAVVDKGLDEKCGQYFIFVVVLDAASCFVIFHATRSLELVE